MIDLLNLLNQVSNVFLFLLVFCILEYFVWTHLVFNDCLVWQIEVQQSSVQLFIIIQDLRPTESIQVHLW